MASSSIRQGADSNKKVQVNSENVKYTDDYVFSQYPYESVKVVREGEKLVAEPTKRMYEFRTGWKVPKLGVMIVGLGGNNGSTLVAGVIANREGICWRTKTGVQRPNYFGSITQASTVRLGVDEAGNDVWIPLCNMVPMVDPNNIEFGGWDINSSNLAEAMERAQVLEYDLQRQLAPHMVNMKPLPSIYSPDYIAMNQADRANNVLTGSKVEMLEKIRADIRNFKKERGVDKVVVIWSANTERYSDVIAGLNDTEDNLMASIRSNEDEISPSTLFAVACIQEHTTYINGSPQNTFVPGVIEMACREGVMIGGDDFKTGQTKMKSVMVDWLISAGIKPVSIVSYNHLGNNDGKNLSAPQQFRSKEISKSNVVDDMVASNPVLYEPHEHPDHCVVIKYVPYVGDSKRAMDEYTSQIFMGGHNTIVMHNTCEDSLLAAPIIMDLVILAELLERIEWKTGDMAEYERFHPIMSLLSYLIKAPLVPPGTPVVNALFKQRAAIENVLRALIGLPVEGFTSLEHRAIPRSKQLEAFSFGQGC